MSTGKTIRKSGLSDIVDDGFIKKHVGNFKEAEKVAETRANTLKNATKSHTISVDEISKIKKEISKRESSGYHIDKNRVTNPANSKKKQFLTEKSYRIFETRWTAKTVGKTKEKMARFYYDMQNGQLYHFDGIH